MRENILSDREAPSTIVDDLLDCYGDVGIDHVHRHGAGWVVLYTVPGTGQRRVACYVDGESEFDFVVESE